MTESLHRELRKKTSNPRIWTTSDGVRLNIDKLSLMHLFNILRMYEDNRYVRENRSEHYRYLKKAAARKMTARGRELKRKRT